MLKTERMKKVVIAGAKPKLRAVIETLHDLKALHIEEHQSTADFGLGSPLPEGEKVANAVLKARGLEKALGLEDETTRKTLTSTDAAIAEIGRLDASLSGLLADRAKALDDAKNLEAEVARLRRLAPLGLRLNHLAGYNHVTAFVGFAAKDPRADLESRTDRFELHIAPDRESGYVLALFVAKDAEAHAEAALVEAGYHAMEVPAGEGTIDAAVGQRITAARQAEATVTRIDGELAAFKAEHGQTLLEASETLSVAAERAGAPVRFAASKNSFVVTGYVPASFASEAESALMYATDGRIHVAWSEQETGGHHGEHDARSEPPIKFGHKANSVKSFTMLLGMHSLPKYKEIDPTILMWITFPIFFGLMVADLAFGLLVGLMALYFKRHYLLGIGGPRVSRMLGLSAIWTVILGVFMFGEAFGIHFVDAADTLSWEHLLHQDWSGYYAGAHAAVDSAAAHGAAAAGAAAAEAEHAAPHLKFGPIQLGYFSKIHDVTVLLAISLGIAAVHLNLAIFIGIVNMWVLHGAKHAIFGRISWLVLEVGVGLLGYGSFVGDSMLVNAGWGALIVAVVMLLIGEGAIAILELPKLFSNALSYTRLVAVGLSKAGMAIAVNKFAFVITGAHSASVAGIGGIILAIVGYTVILALGVLAGGLHSMRLQFVEFFGWFYEGGGREFKAFGDPNQRT